MDFRRSEAARVRFQPGRERNDSTETGFSGYRIVSSKGRDYRSDSPEGNLLPAHKEFPWSENYSSSGTASTSASNYNSAHLDEERQQPRLTHGQERSKSTQSSSHRYRSVSPASRSSGKWRADTLDDVDIESLIASYRPLMHPAASNAALARGESLRDARRAMERSLSQSSAGASDGVTPKASRSATPQSAAMQKSASVESSIHRRDSYASSSSCASGGGSKFILPSATANPLQDVMPSSRRSSTISVKSALKRQDSSPVMTRRPSLIPGEMYLDESAEKPSHVAHNGMNTVRALPSLQRTLSQYSASSTTNSDDIHQSSSPTATSYMTGSIGFGPVEMQRRPSAQRSLSSSSQTSSSALPSRFSFATPVVAGPGSLYRQSSSGSSTNKPPDGPLPIPEALAEDATKGESPRSSMSSKSTNSFRWSAGSGKTTSTGESSLKESGRRDSLETSGRTSILPESEARQPAKSWLSFDDDDDENEDAGVIQDVMPTRKNSLWRESLDSVTSSVTEGNESILAQDFPQPPPLSRSNSIATTTTKTTGDSSKPSPATLAPREPASANDDITPESESTTPTNPASATATATGESAHMPPLLSVRPSIGSLRSVSSNSFLPVHSVSPLRAGEQMPQVIAGVLSLPTSIIPTPSSPGKSITSVKVKQVRYAL